jgi:hypothetical protein
MGHTMSPADSRHRGVLLLIVLSMLTLFMMLGVTYLVVSTRARKTARAFADNVVSTTASGINAQRLLDEAMMAVARGTTGTSAISALRNGDDLLGDKYGQSAVTSGTISANATGAAIIAIPTTLLPNPELLAGRVLTFTMPTLNDVSTRILQAHSSGNLTTIYIPGGQSVSGAAITAATINAAKQAATSTPHFIVNGREFDGGPGDTNEPYDALATSGSASDPYLGQVTVVSGTTSVTPSFAASISGTTIDNDVDGTPDSGWIDVGLPRITDLSGNGVKPKAAILVIDLDGRVNVNAHGTRTDLENTGSSTDCGNTGTNFYPTIVFSTTASSGTIPMQVLPRGVGAGVAEISLFGPLVPSASSTGLAEVLGGSSRGTGLNEPGPDAVTKRPWPNLGDTEGRYADSVFDRSNPNPLASAAPGKLNVDDNTTADRWVSSSGPASYTRFFEDPSTRYGSPADLKGRMRVWTDAFGQPVYYKPYWGKSGGGNTNRGQFADDEVVDDPYEVNLGRSGPRTGEIRASLSSPADNIYTPADLEGALRFFDPDSMRLSRRLMSLCRENASVARTLVTTESWDTPAVTGTAWRNVISSTSAFSTILTLSNAADFFSPETIMGHKLDLNRPFHDPMVTGSAASYSEPNDPDGTARRQQFAKHLYCLFVALYQANSGTTPSTIGAEQLAQWAVNIVDFRDDDSVMTPFDYDENFKRANTSWNPTKRVWGVERPEILITETLAWHDRRTDDMTPDGRVTDRTNPDDDFDQTYRPRGAFFVELYSPWGSQAMQYSGTVADVTGTNGRAYRAEPLPAEFVSGATQRFERTATLNLACTHNSGSNALASGTIPGATLKISGTASPVWRLATVRGTGTAGNAFGPDPFVTGSSGSSGWIVDPSRTGTTASIDRVFYFTVPSQANLAEKPGAVYWQSGTSTVQPSQTRYVVVGTNLLPFDYTPETSGTALKADRCFDYPPFKPATISEPIVTTQTIRDGYDAVFAAIAGDNDETKGVFFGSYGTGLVTPIDKPVDSETDSFETISLPFLDASGQPILMQNGTHENFAVVHLQRLADPNEAWDATKNPYLTVDSMPIDLTVVNTAGVSNFELNAIVGENYDEPNHPAKNYNNYSAGPSFSSTERGGKQTDGGSTANESDIWTRRVTSGTNGNSLSSSSTFRTLGKKPVPAVQLNKGTVPPAPYQLQPRPATFGDASLVSGTTNAATAKPGNFSTTRFPWLFWANRPFTSAAELALVPTPNAFHLPAMHTTATGTTAGTKPGQGRWGAGTRGFAHLSGLLDSGTLPPDPFKFVIGSTGSSSQPGILDFVHVPSRFTGSYVTISSTAANAATIGLDQFPLGQISHFREPGRVNVNTLAMASFTSGTSWNPLFGTVVTSSTTSSPPPFFGVTGTTPSGSAIQPPYTPPAWNLVSPQNPFGPSGSAAPAANLLTVLTKIKADSTDNSSNWPQELQAARDHGQDAFFRYDMPLRMANLVTTRSNVFAIWVTIGYFDDSGQEIEPKRRNRAFYIFDRSIPVGYEAGKDHNARDAVLLRRIIQ